MNELILTAAKIRSIGESIFGPERVWIYEQNHIDEEAEEDIVEDDDEDEDGEFVGTPTLPMMNKGDRNNPVHILVHFPELTITNSQGHEHLLRDLFIRLYCTPIKRRQDHDRFFNYNFQGMRTTFTVEEMMSGGYIHSHLMGGIYSWSGFCMGSSEFGLHLYNLAMEPTEENWTLFFLGLPRYLGWESLEGGPYKRINGIGLDRSETLDVEPYLKRMLHLMPRTFFFYTNQLQFNEGHPDVYQFFNYHSPVKQYESRASNERMQELQGSYQRQLTTELRWKEGTGQEKHFMGKVLYFPKKMDDSMLDPSILNLYITSLKELINNYNKQQTYERAKQKYQNLVFTQAGVGQPA